MTFPWFSPAAWQPQPYGLPNDAPPVTAQPYLVGKATLSGNVSQITITVQNPTSPGDAVVVGATSSNSGVGPTTCTDTQGNAYSLVNFFTTTKATGQWVAQNTRPLGPGDAITASFASASSVGGHQAIAVACPAAALVTSPGRAWLTYDMANANGQGVAGPLGVTANPIGRPCRYQFMAIAFSCTGNGAGPAQWPQGWTVLSPSAIPGSDWVSVAYKLFTTLPGGGNVVYTLQGAANCTLQYVTLIPETRIAAAPPVPPGRLSPGSWPPSPLPRGGNATATTVLAAVAATTGTVQNQVAKDLPGTVTTSGALQDQASKALAATAATAVTAASQASKALTATVTATAALTRAATKALAVTVTTATALARGIGKILSAAARTAGSVITQLIPGPRQPGIVTITPYGPLTAVAAPAPAQAAVLTIAAAGAQAAVLTASSAGQQPATWEPPPPLALAPAPGPVPLPAIAIFSGVPEVGIPGRFVPGLARH